MKINLWSIFLSLRSTSHFVGRLRSINTLYPMSSPYLLSDMLHHVGHSPAQRADNVSEGYSLKQQGAAELIAAGVSFYPQSG